MIYTLDPLDRDEPWLLTDHARRKGMDLEYHCTKRFTQGMLFNNGSLRKQSHEDLVIKHIRVIDNQNMGLFSTSMPIEDLDQVLVRIFPSTRYGKPVGFMFAGEAEFPSPRIHDKKVEDLNLGTMSDICKSIHQYIYEKDKEAEYDLSLGIETSSVNMINTRGFAHGYKRTGYFLNLWIRKKHGDKSILNYDKFQRPRISDASHLVDEMLREITWSYRDAGVERNPPFLPVVLSPSLVSYLMQFILGIASANMIDMQNSCVKLDMAGTKLMDEKITITDDGTADWKQQSRPFDDEGVPTRRTAVIENGKLNAFLCDQHYAKILNLKSTGNFKYVNNMPTIIFGNATFSKGDLSFDQLLKTVNNGLFVGTGMVHGDGEGNFMIIPKNSYKIENGEVAGTIVDSYHLAGNLFQILRDLIGISEETKITRLDMEAPYLACNGLRIV